MTDTLVALQSSETAILRGDFVILFKHGLWHLIGTRLFESERHIISVHVMTPERARSALAETPSAKPKSYAELGSMFNAEVRSKVLAQAEDYLPLFRSHAVSLSAGFHADTMQQIEHTPEKERSLVEAVSHMMKSGDPGLCLYFKPNAVERSRLTRLRVRTP
jgi:hypothetical protein